jgi:hypothetical protein
VSTTFLSPSNSTVTTTPGQIFNSLNAQLITWKSSDTSGKDVFGLSGFPCAPASCGSMAPVEGRLYDWNLPVLSASGVVGGIVAISPTGASTSTVPFTLQSVLPLAPPGGPSLPINCPNAASSTIAGSVCLTLAPETATCGANCYASGFADPSIRRDPALFGTGLWLAYSIGESCDPAGPVCGTGTTPAIGIHLVSSHDGGATWGSPTTLYTPSYVAVDSPSCNNYTGSPGYAYTSHEGISLATDDVGYWYGIHQEYCIKSTSDILYTNIYPYTGALVLAKAATSPANLQSPTMSARFRNANLSTMAGVPPETCMSFDEPALLIYNSRIYLFVQCLPPPGSSVPPQYYTLTAPIDSDWSLVSSWSEYGPPFGGPVDANRYYGGSSFLTEFDIAQRSDETFIAIVTPATGLNPENHLGCLAVEFTLPTASSSSDNYFGTAYADLNDNIGSASALGNSGCTFDPASATGLLLSRKARSPGGSVASILETGLMP